MKRSALAAGLVATVIAGAADIDPCLAQAGSTADFYAGKQITFIVGTAAGGGYDAYARILAPHLSSNIPGKPNIVVQNMPGSAGLTAAVLNLN